MPVSSPSPAQPCLGQQCPSPCVPAQPEPCLLPLSWNIYPFCWSYPLIKYLHRGPVVLGRAESRDVASLSHSTRGSRKTQSCLWVRLSLCRGMACHYIPHCNVGVSRPLGRGLPGEDPLQQPAWASQHCTGAFPVPRGREDEDVAEESQLQKGWWGT